MMGLVVAAAVLAAGMTTAAPGDPRPLAPYRPAPEQGCTVPVAGQVSGLAACPDVRREPPVSCVVPVAHPPGTLVTEECRAGRPGPEGRIIPLTR